MDLGKLRWGMNLEWVDLIFHLEGCCVSQMPYIRATLHVSLLNANNNTQKTGKSYFDLLVHPLSKAWSFIRIRIKCISYPLLFIASCPVFSLQSPIPHSSTKFLSALILVLILPVSGGCTESLTM